MGNSIYGCQILSHRWLCHHSHTRKGRHRCRPLDV